MINVAIVGAGNISPAHIKGFLEFPQRCKIVAICDIYKEKAAEKKKRFGLNDAIVYENYKEILKMEDVDVVDICTPPYTHANIAVDSLNAGKNVIVEKPMAASLEECDKMLEASRKNKKLLSVISQNRFRTQFMKLKKVVESGLAGDIVHAQVDSFWWRDHSYYDLWWRGTWEKEGGGCTLNHAIHHIDMLIWLLGMPEEVQAVMNNVAHDNAEVEDISIAILKYKNGALAQITSSVVHHGEEQQIVLQGKKARISVPWRVYASVASNNGFPAGRDEKLEKEIQDYYDSIDETRYEGHTPQLDDVLKALELNRDVLVKGEDGRNALELITAIYKAASTRQVVKLPIEKYDPFYTVSGIMASVPHFYEKKTFVENFSDERITFGRDIK
ncbi:Gfo/Idh/MocA family protein [Caldanaerobius polysaccharolyticus]|uniref:Gfo/Idh/MocA family protein n=1 Tax=Caldanaerobius polysaccharolyticus TaxID=44256 RepID=UPI00047E041D|nr:Gfo/Idh/MocA family oxidoreductase [Caldanaerobius polysaccharolyticus]